MVGRAGPEVLENRAAERQRGCHQTQTLISYDTDLVLAHCYHKAYRSWDAGLVATPSASARRRDGCYSSL